MTARAGGIREHNLIRLDLGLGYCIDTRHSDKLSLRDIAVDARTRQDVNISRDVLSYGFRPGL